MARWQRNISVSSQHIQIWLASKIDIEITLQMRLNSEDMSEWVVRRVHIKVYVADLLPTPARPSVVPFILPLKRLKVKFIQFAPFAREIMLCRNLHPFEPGASCSPSNIRWYPWFNMTSCECIHTDGFGFGGFIRQDDVCLRDYPRIIGASSFETIMSQTHANNQPSIRFLPLDGILEEA